MWKILLFAYTLHAALAADDESATSYSRAGRACAESAWPTIKDRRHVHIYENFRIAVLLAMIAKGIFDVLWGEAAKWSPSGTQDTTKRELVQRDQLGEKVGADAEGMTSAVANRYARSILFSFLLDGRAMAHGSHGMFG